MNEKRDYSYLANAAPKEKPKDQESRDFSHLAYASQPDDQEESSGGFFSPEQMKAGGKLAKKGGLVESNPFKDFSLAEYSKGFYPSVVNTLANQSASLNNLVGGNVPHQPELKKSKNKWENVGQQAGEIAPDFVPGATGFKAANLIKRAPEGAKLLQKLLTGGARLGVGAGAGAATGAALDEKRMQGAESGAMQGAGAIAIPGTMNYIGNKFGKNAVTKAEEAVQNAMKQYEEHAANVAKTKGESGAKYNLTDVERFPHRIEAKQEALQQAQQERQGLPNEEFPQGVLHPAHTQLELRAQQEAQRTNEAISNELQHGQPNDEHLAQDIAHHFEGRPTQTPNGERRMGGLKQELGDEFQAIDKTFEGKKVSTPNKVNEKEIEELAKIHLGEHSSPLAYKSFMEQTRNYYKDLAGNGIEDAQKLYKKYRALTMQATEDRMNLAKRGLTPEDVEKYKGLAGAKEAEAAEIEKVLKEQVGGESFKRLQAVKKRWATENAPVTELKHYQNWVEHERVNERNIPSLLRGSHKGNVILRNYIQSNPNTANLLASHEFAARPEELMNLNATQRGYINPERTPDLHNLMMEQQRAHEAVPIARAQQEHFSEINKNVQQQLKLHEAERAKAIKLDQQIPKLQHEISDLNRLETKLRKELEAKDLSKKAKDEKNKALVEAVAKKQRFEKRVKSARNVIGAAFALDLYGRKHR